MLPPSHRSREIARCETTCTRTLRNVAAVSSGVDPFRSFRAVRNWAMNLERAYRCFGLTNLSANPPTIVISGEPRVLPFSN